MPSRRIITQNKHFNLRNIASERAGQGDVMGKSFDQLKQELYVINDRKKIFMMTWYQTMAVMIFLCGIVILVLLQF